MIINPPTVLSPPRRPLRAPVPAPVVAPSLVPVALPLPDPIAGALRALWDRIRFAIAGPPRGPFPSMVELAARFPQAGLPARMIGTTIDNDALDMPGSTPEGLIAKVAAMGMNTVRLGAYWNRIQPDGPQGWDFAELDRLLAAADRHGVRVILSVGAKSPCWPEYHVPAWAEARPGDRRPDQDAAFRQRAEAYVTAVARRYAGHPAIAMWQVENEPFDPSGPEKRALGSAFVAREAAILRAADGGRRPLLINGWSAFDRRDELERAFAIADVVGLDVYTHTPGPLGGYERTVGVPRWALDMAKRTGTPVMIAELQADDWSDFKATPASVERLYGELAAMGYRDFLFWRLRQNLKNEAQGDDGLTRVLTRLSSEALATR